MNENVFIEKMVDLMDTEDDIQMDTALEDIEEWDSLSYVSFLAWCAKEAKKVWEKFGIADRMGWSIVNGHGHCQLPESQFPEVAAFIDKFLLGKDVKTDGVAVEKF